MEAKGFKNWAGNAIAVHTIVFWPITTLRHKGRETCQVGCYTNRCAENHGPNSEEFDLSISFYSLVHLPISLSFCHFLLRKLSHVYPLQTLHDVRKKLRTEEKEEERSGERKGLTFWEPHFCIWVANHQLISQSPFWPSHRAKMDFLFPCLIWGGNSFLTFAESWLLSIEQCHPQNREEEGQVSRPVKRKLAVLVPMRNGLPLKFGIFLGQNRCWLRGGGSKKLALWSGIAPLDVDCA